MCSSDLVEAGELVIRLDEGEVKRGIEEDPVSTRIGFYHVVGGPYVAGFHLRDADGVMEGTDDPGQYFGIGSAGPFRGHQVNLCGMKEGGGEAQVDRSALEGRGPVRHEVMASMHGFNYHGVVRVIGVDVGLDLGMDYRKESVLIPGLHHEIKNRSQDKAIHEHQKMQILPNLLAKEVCLLHSAAYVGRS